MWVLGAQAKRAPGKGRVDDGGGFDHVGEGAESRVAPGRDDGPLRDDETGRADDPEHAGRGPERQRGRQQQQGREKPQHSTPLGLEIEIVSWVSAMFNTSSIRSVRR